MMHIGELFILRININLQGSVLDSPELMWSEPELEPVYAAVRSYLEITQRVSLLNQRLDVIGDLVGHFFFFFFFFGGLQQEEKQY